MLELQLVVVTPETTLVDEPVAGLRFPLFDGSAGVLPGRAPLVGRLGAGELNLTAKGGGHRSYFVDGGFVQITGDRTLYSGRQDRQGRRGRGASVGLVPCRIF